MNGNLDFIGTTFHKEYLIALQRPKDARPQALSGEIHFADHVVCIQEGLPMRHGKRKSCSKTGARFQGEKGLLQRWRGTRIFSYWDTLSDTPCGVRYRYRCFNG